MEKTANKYRVPLKVPQGAEEYVSFAPPIKAPKLLGDIRTRSYTNPDFGASHVFVGQVQSPGPLKEYVAFTDEDVLSLTSLTTELAGYSHSLDLSLRAMYGNGMKREDYGALAGRAQRQAFDPYRRMFEQNHLSHLVVRNVKERLSSDYLRGEGWPSFNKGKVVYRDEQEEVVVRALGGAELSLNLGGIREEQISPRPSHRFRSQLHDYLHDYDDDTFPNKSVNFFYPTMRWQSDEFGQRVISVNPMDDELFFACYASFLRFRGGHTYDVTGYNNNGLTFAPDRFNPLVGLMTVAYMMKREQSLWKTRKEAPLLHDKPWAVPLYLIGKMPDLARSEFYDRCETHFKKWEISENGQKVA